MHSFRINKFKKKKNSTSPPNAIPNPVEQVVKNLPINCKICTHKNDTENSKVFCIDDVFITESRIKAMMIRCAKSDRTGTILFNNNIDPKIN